MGSDVSTWKDEFDRRCRRLVGVTDDSRPVDVEIEHYYYSEETCGDTSVSILCGGMVREFANMGAIIRALDETPDV